jgi:hypothetical protein
VGGVAGSARVAASSMPSATAWVISASHSRSVGGASTVGAGAGASGAGRAGALDPRAHPLAHPATISHAIHRMMHRC